MKKPRRAAIAAALLIIMIAAAGLWLGGRAVAPFSTQRQSPSDQQHFAAWRAGPVKAEVAALEAYLASQQLADVVPLADVLRSDVRWRRCKAEPFAMPPRQQWANMAKTLRYIRAELIPAVGPVRVVSGYRAPATNDCVKGARASRHLRFAALDMEPAAAKSRTALISALCPLHASTGSRDAVGLGIYDGVRFHIDTAGFRRWGRDYRSASSPCA